MKKRNFITVNTLISSTLLFTSPVFAQENQERVTIGTEVSQDFSEERSREHEANIQREDISEKDQPVIYKSNLKSSVGNFFDQEAQISHAAVYYNSHQDGYHQVSTAAPEGGVIELQDGSVWEIKWSDRYKTRNWQPNQNVLVTPNRSWLSGKPWFSSYKFKLVHVEYGEAAKANITLGPLLDSFLSHWIQQIDYDKRMIWLEDGSTWSMSWFDGDELIKHFAPYDYVFIGTNDGWWKSLNPNILINLKNFEYIRGKCIN